MSFTRRFTADPGQAVILAIEGVVIIDQEPPGAVSGVGSGFTCLVGEFEDGPYGIPYEVSNNNDLLNTFGGFGFTYGGVPSNNPCARGRQADGQLAVEYWNGNGFIALVNKKFSRLACVRVDTSVGSVQFTPLPSVSGGSSFEFALTTGQILAFDIGAGPVSATFTGMAAAKASSAGTFPTTFAGGEHMQLVVDAGTPQQIGPVDVYFQASDQTQSQVVSRMNLAVGYPCFSVGGANVTNAVGRVKGSSGNFQILSQDTLVGTKLGFATTVSNGTGNVADINKVKFAELQSVVAAAITGVTIDRDSNNNIRAVAAAAPSITVSSTTTASAFGFVPGATDAQATALAGTIPAGTRVRNSGGAEWVTAQTISYPANAVGPFTVKVRPALDDGSGLSAVAGALNVVPAAVPGGAWSVINPLPITAALTEGQLDAAYAFAFDATLSPNAVTRQCNIILSARASNTVRQKTKSNVILASSGGLYGRIACVRPPLGTKRVDAKSITTQPGVGAYRSDRVVYCFPACNTNIPQIGARGVAGGAGFSADGNLDVGMETWTASVMSQLPPEENPGQLTGYMALVNGLEVGNPDVQNMDVNDYISFKSSGIAALFMQDGVATIESGIMSVDPLVNPSLVSIGRRRMADFIQDSLAVVLKPYVKKKATRVRRGEIYGLVQAFLEGLTGGTNQAAQRIDSYLLDAKSGNTPTALAAGIYRLIVKVALTPDLIAIVLQTTIGENVDTSSTFVQLAA